MTITVRLFAMLRDLAGMDACRIALAHGANVLDARRALGLRQPRLTPWLEVARPALNLDYCSSDAALHDGDELCFIPPVSGG